MKQNNLKQYFEKGKEMSYDE